MTRQGKANQGKARYDKTRHDKTRQGKARQGKTRQDKARQGKTRQGKIDKDITQRQDPRTRPKDRHKDKRQGQDAEKIHNDKRITLATQPIYVQHRENDTSIVCWTHMFRCH